MSQNPDPFDPAHRTEAEAVSLDELLPLAYGAIARALKSDDEALAFRAAALVLDHVNKQAVLAAKALATPAQDKPEPVSQKKISAATASATRAPATAAHAKDPDAVLQTVHTPSKPFSAPPKKSRRQRMRR